MSSSPTSSSPNQPSLRYESVGYASIEVASNKDGVSLVANRDGLRSLARLFDAMAAHEGEYAHLALLPTLQLTESSEPLDLNRIDRGSLPDGSEAPSSF